MRNWAEKKLTKGSHFYIFLKLIKKNIFSDSVPIVSIFNYTVCKTKGETVVVVFVRELDLQLPVQSVLITTKLVSSNPAHGKVYSIKHYVIKFVNDLRQFGAFLRLPPPIKLSATK